MTARTPSTTAPPRFRALSHGGRSPEKSPTRRAVAEYRRRVTVPSSPPDRAPIDSRVFVHTSVRDPSDPAADEYDGDYYEMLSAGGITSFIPVAVICTLSYYIAEADAGIDCFKCVSLEWQNRACDDPFHNNFSSGLLESPCMGGRKGRNGVFPATACIKLTGYYQTTGQHVTVRGCALDSGTLTTDTEIIRMSHCGGFYFDDKYVEGCLQSCDDADGCNPGSPSAHSNVTLLMVLVVMPLVIGLIPQEWANV